MQHAPHSLRAFFFALDKVQFTVNVVCDLGLQDLSVAGVGYRPRESRIEFESA